MKSLRIAALSLLVVLWAVPAHASTIPPDPHYKTGGCTSCSGLPGATAPFGDQSVPAGIITPDFSILSPSGASPATSACVLIQGTIMTPSKFCLFENDITVNSAPVAITKLLFDVGGLIPGTVVSCGFLTGSPFAMCTPGTAGDGGQAQVTFFDGSIPFHGDFTLEVGSPEDPFPPNTKSGVKASLSPEPGTLALFLGGIGALLIGRWLRAHRLG